MRNEGWEERFALVVMDHSQRPFEWGASDCLAFPMDVVRALIGETPEGYATDYHNAKQAASRLKKLGYKNIEEAFADNFREVAPAFAQRGDIGVADYEGAVLGGGVVVLGEHIMAKTEKGTLRLPRDRLKRAFRVE